MYQMTPLYSENQPGKIPLSVHVGYWGRKSHSKREKSRRQKLEADKPRARSPSNKRSTPASPSQLRPGVTGIDSYNSQVDLPTSPKSHAIHNSRFT